MLSLGPGRANNFEYLSESQFASFHLPEGSKECVRIVYCIAAWTKVPQEDFMHRKDEMIPDNLVTNCTGSKLNLVKFKY